MRLRCRPRQREHPRPRKIVRLLRKKRKPPLPPTRPILPPAAGRRTRIGARRSRLVRQANLTLRASRGRRPMKTRLKRVRRSRATALRNHKSKAPRPSTKPPRRSPRRVLLKRAHPSRATALRSHKSRAPRPSTKPLRRRVLLKRARPSPATALRSRKSRAPRPSTKVSRSPRAGEAVTYECVWPALTAALAIFFSGTNTRHSQGIPA